MILLLYVYLMKLQHSRQLFKEQNNIKFHIYPSGGSRFVAGTDRRTDGQTDRETC